MKILLQGGSVVSADGIVRADVLISGETVEAVGTNLRCDDAEIRDVSGKLLFPGFIDAHTHFDLDVCNTTTADDFYSGGCAAIRGGTTTVIDFASPERGETLQVGLDRWHEKARKNGCACDYGFHMTVVEWNDQVAHDLPTMFEQGVSSFKMYMTYGFQLNDHDLFRTLQSMKAHGGVVGVHCENSGVIDALIEQNKAAGHTDPTAHPESRPAILEAEAVARLLRLAKLADVPVVIVHLSSAEGLDAVQAARAQGQTVWVETCPQYLYLDDSSYALPDFEGGRYVCAPPLRKKADCERLWRALSDGSVQTVSTDHCSFTLAQKDAGRDDFTKIPGGLPGVETRALLLFDGAAEGRITEAQMCALLAENPARLYGLYPRKGVIAPGSDADIVVIDPAAETVIRAEEQVGRAGYSPFEGLHLRGGIESVWLRGSLAAENGTLLRDRGGIFLERGRGAL